MANHQMNNEDMMRIKNLTLAPYIQLAVSLIDKPRECLSNMFRHAFSTLGILIDYGYTDPVLLKAAVIHDLIEDIPDFDQKRILELEDGPAVLQLVLEVTKRKGESKPQFLNRIKNTGSDKAKILKSADRISNVCELGFITKKSFVSRYINETEKYILPIAEDVNKYMVVELKDLIASRKKMLEILNDNNVSI